MLKIKSFTFNPFYENTYVLYDEHGEAAIVDPGCYEPYEQQELIDFVNAEGLKVKQLVNTHAHIDHVLGNAFVKRHFGVELWSHREDAATLRAVETYATNYGFARYEPSSAEHYLLEGDIFMVGNIAFEILFVPGHAPGHLALYNADAKAVIAGDVLFQRSIGRTDLPGGDFDTLIRSIHTKMFSLPDDTVVYCGHGPTTTIGEEKAHNPFCAIRS